MQSIKREENNMIEIKNNILSKWYIILLCAIITSGLLYFEKSKINTNVRQTGDMIYTRTVRFNKIPTFTEGQTTTEIDLSKIMKMASNEDKMIKLLDNNFAISKLDKTLINKGNLNKIKWIHEHFYTEKIGPGVYELVMKFGRTDAKDAIYIDNNSYALMDTFEDCFKESSMILVEDSELSIVNDYNIVEEMEPSSTKNTNKKYAIIGLILGSLLGIVFVMAWNAFHIKA